MSDNDVDTVNQAHVLVEEAFELAEQKLEQDEVTAEDVVEVGEKLKEASEHEESDIWVTLTAEGFKNQCMHHKFPDGPYSYEPHESPRECLEKNVNHEIKVEVK